MGSTLGPLDRAASHEADQICTDQGSVISAVMPAEAIAEQTLAREGVKVQVTCPTPLERE